MDTRVTCETPHRTHGLYSYCKLNVFSGLVPTQRWPWLVSICQERHECNRIVKWKSELEVHWCPRAYKDPPTFPREASRRRSLVKEAEFLEDTHPSFVIGQEGVLIPRQSRLQSLCGPPPTSSSVYQTQVANKVTTCHWGRASSVGLLAALLQGPTEFFREDYPVIHFRALDSKDNKWTWFDNIRVSFLIYIWGTSVYQPLV